jgi:hypothetical protein
MKRRIIEIHQLNDPLIQPRSMQWATVEPRQQSRHSMKFAD